MTWRQFIHNSHHPYIERWLERHRQAGRHIEWNTKTNCWSWRSKDYRTCSLVDQAVAEKGERPC